MPHTHILTAEQMRRCDAYTIEVLGVSSRVLMERAAAEATRFLLSRKDLFPHVSGSVILLCGSGNNGGDGWAMARFLRNGSQGESRDARVYYGGALTPDGVPDTTRMSVECRRQYELAVAAGVPVLPPDAPDDVSPSSVDAVVDALFGIGLDRPITGAPAHLIAWAKKWNRPVLAVDIPSGVHADSGAPLGDTYLPAVATVTMQAPKRGTVLFPGADICGEIYVADIGISLDPIVGESAPRLCDGDLLRAALPPRPRRSNKGTYGRVALLVGSLGMAGAGYLAASATLRTGIGLCEILTPEANRVIYQVTLPCAMVTPVDRLAPAEVAARTLTANGLVVGCGMGTSPEAATRLEAILNAWPADPTHPLVLDADALNLLAAHPRLWDTAVLAARGGNVVITPHPGEMARLCGTSVSEVAADLLGMATTFAAKRGVTVVLKDAHTVIASPHGSAFLCTAGNPGMATGGCGDVLAGVIASLLTQNRHRLTDPCTVTDITAAAVYLHALAGDSAAHRLGSYPLCATDLLDCLPEVVRGYESTGVREIGFQGASTLDPG